MAPVGKRSWFRAVAPVCNRFWLILSTCLADGPRDVEYAPLPDGRGSDMGAPR